METDLPDLAKILPSKRIFNSVFRELVYYVENDCAEKRITLKPNEYSWWEKTVVKYFPKKFSKNLRRNIGLNYINDMMILSGEEYVYARELYKRVYKLYMWYTKEYLFIDNPWNTEHSGPKYVDKDGNEAEAFIDETAETINTLHPTYVDYLKNNLEKENTQFEIMENNLQELLRIRHIL